MMNDLPLAKNIIYVFQRIGEIWILFTYQFLSIIYLQSAPPKEADVTNDTSTFIAATTDETLGGAGNQLMARRAAAANTADDKEQAPAKELRRDSKGFENFDDYFDSDGNDTTINTAGDKTIDESVEEAAVSATEEVLCFFCNENCR